MTKILENVSIMDAIHFQNQDVFMRKKLGKLLRYKCYLEHLTEHLTNVILPRMSHVVCTLVCKPSTQLGVLFCLI